MTGFDTATVHRPGAQLMDDTSRGWGLLLGHQRGPHTATSGDFATAMDSLHVRMGSLPWARLSTSSHRSSSCSYQSTGAAAWLSPPNHLEPPFDGRGPVGPVASASYVINSRAPKAVTLPRLTSIARRIRVSNSATPAAAKSPSRGPRRRPRSSRHRLSPRCRRETDIQWMRLLPLRAPEQGLTPCVVTREKLRPRSRNSLSIARLWECSSAARSKCSATSVPHRMKSSHCASLMTSDHS
ncbi:hypothetical protein [Ornithinimicrobium kibberense]|uniref:hypothetical protein n=1 Tax=Ornithinimicrobium kibberense TaxID=282060 RepID=UPI00361A7C7B